ncbi:MAG: hypothetical protein GY858_08925 [Candidatus Omnitrophica bacterium]|nr:hypothetical protein [Candidatus Omnitrophota bacterium]
MKKDSVIYHSKKSKGAVVSFFGYLRDCVFFYFPFKRVPQWVRKGFYKRIDYVFFIHPRRSEDWYLGLPFLSILRKFLKKERMQKIVSKMPPVVVSSIESNRGRGVIMSSIILPERVMGDRKNSVAHAVGAVKFSRRISEGQCVVGLGAWWPIVTRRGEALRKAIADDNVIITNGHTGTAISMYMMIDKISNISGLKLNEFKIAVIGAGKMGTNIARILNGKVAELAVVDINEVNLRKIYDELQNSQSRGGTKIVSFLRKGGESAYSLLDKYHLAICVTSNARIVVKSDELPDYFIMIDDSRPEAISRKMDLDKKLVLEGGIMKIIGAKTNYDYGFGVGQNVFGCLAETYALSIDKGKTLKPSLGDVDLSNFRNMLGFYRDNGIEVGDFKSGDKLIENEKIREFIHRRNRVVREEGETDVSV